MTEPSSPTPEFEEALTSLETLVTRLEQGELPLEQALAAFEQGIQLSRQCQASLQQAEQRVRMLLEDGSESDTAVPNHD